MTLRVLTVAQLKNIKRLPIMRAKNLLHFLPVCLTALAILPVSSRAQSITNADASATLNVGSAWVGGNAPGPANIAVWNSIVQVNTNVTLGADLSWGGIQILNPGGPISVLADGNTLTNGTLGIDLSQATNELILDCPVVLNGNQTWMATNGMTLTVDGVISGSSLLTLNNGGNNNGSIVLGGANTYTGGTVINSGVAQPNTINAFGTGTVTNNGAMLELSGFPHSGVMVNSFYVTGTSFIDMANIDTSFVLNGSWSGPGTIIVTNDTSSGSTLTFGGASSSANMANFTGSIIVADNASSTPSAGTLRFNNGGGQYNTGSSAMSVNLGGTSPTSPGSTIVFGNRDAGTTSFGQLTGGPGTAIEGQTSGSGTETWSIGGLNTSFTFAGTIENHSSSALAALTKVGTGTMTLTGTNTATGQTTINAGVLQIGDGNADGTLPAGLVVNNASLVFNRAGVYTVANNISGGGTITIQAGGTNTYTGTNSSSGTTIISQGDLVLGPSGLISSPISLTSAGTFDVSQNTSFTLNQTLSGSGTVTGLLSAVSGTIYPGGTGTAGTLTFQSGLTESGGVNNQFTLSTPTGTNDFISVAGNLTLTGVNNILLNTFGGGTLANGTYPLIGYSGALSGGIANLAVTAVGVTGTLTNITSTIPPEIAVIISPASRGPTNLTWKGDGVLNEWNTTSSNWFNGVISYAFQAGDSVLFNDLGAPNTNVNLVIAALPASVTFSNTLHYTLSGNGSIGGSVGLTKTNIGIVTVLTTNSYTGPTIVGQGVLEVQNVGISGAPSGIGAATTNPTNLVFYGSTFMYSGPSGSTDHGMTLNGAGAIFDVTNGADLTLSGNITGPGALGLTDSGTLTLANPNTYSGGTVISNGVLALGSNNANNNGAGGSGVGATNEPVTLEGGTLQLYGYGLSDSPNYNTFYNPLVVPTGQTGTLLMFPRGPINTGGGSGLNSGLSGGGTLNLKVNYVRDALSGNWSAFTGLILVTNASAAGGDEFRINNNFGYSNATIYLNGPVIMDSALTANATINIGALGGVSSAVIGPGNATQPGPTWCVGWNNTTSTFAGTIEDDNTAPGGHTSIIKVGTGTLTLVGGVIAIVTNPTGFADVTNLLATNLVDYTGDTTISNGTLALVVPDLLTNSPIVTLAAPLAILDASDMGYVSNLTTPLPDGSTNELVTNSIFEVVSGQTLEGVGTLNGILQADSGSTFNIGLPTGAFNVTSNASLSGAITMSLKGNASSELVAPAITVNASATLLVTNAGPGLINGTTFTLFDHPVSFADGTVTLPPTDPTGTTNYVWANNLASNGTITLTSGGLPPGVPPIAVSISGKTLTLSWSSSGYTLQMQTNSLSVGISTNWVSIPGSSAITSTNITINPSTPSAFFRLTQ